MVDAQACSQPTAMAPLAFELFASDDQLAVLEARHAMAPAAPALALAWALRQRDPDRALQLARALTEDPEAQPRLWLIEGERALAHEQVGEAQNWAERAMHAFEARQDDIGLSDAHLLFGHIAAERTLRPEERAAHAAAAAAAERAEEPCRQRYHLFLLAAQDVVNEGLQHEALWQGQLPASVEGPALASAQACYQAARGARHNDFARTATQYGEAYAQALNSGQGWVATLYAHNAAVMWEVLGDADSALLWAQRCLDLARRICPSRTGLALIRCGAVLLGLGQLDEAREVVTEAVKLGMRQPESPLNFLAVDQLGLVEAASGRHEAAVNLFSAAIACPNIWPAKRVEIVRQRCVALLKLGRLEEAEEAAVAALAVDPKVFFGASRLEMRATQADIWLAQGKTRQAAQAYTQILADGTAIDGYVLEVHLQEGAATAHAAVGDFAQAYALSRGAIEAHQRNHSSEAEKRARAIYTQQRIERVQLDAEHQRSLAQAAAERLAMLEKLGDTGRALTAELDGPRALDLLDQHIRRLLPQQGLSVHLLDVAGETLVGALGAEALPPVSIGDAVSPVARCARERQLLLLEAGRVMLAPLEVGARQVGVVRLQGEAAYGPEQQLVFKTLCAYLAVALDNARAYAQLRQVQRHVQAQERMAALGSLVAGVAHELNTPIGNALMSSSTLSAALRDFEGKLQAGALRRSDWESFGGQLREGLYLIDHGVQAAAQLVNNFKQVAQDRSQQHRSHFRLRELCEMLLLQRRAELEPAGHVLHIDIDPELVLDSYPGSLAQALTLLLANAVQHGLSGQRPGRIEISARLLPLNRLALSVQDDGPGMSAHVMARAFEPFFTTTFGRGGNGLGLSICHNIVADVLGGEVRASSEPGQGACFTIEMPISAV